MTLLGFKDLAIYNNQLLPNRLKIDQSKFWQYEINYPEIVENLIFGKFCNNYL